MNPTQEKNSGKGKRRFCKPQNDCISTFVYQRMSNNRNSTMGKIILNSHNDMPVQIDEESYKLLRDSGGDPALSQHIFHVFIRDALVIFDL